MAEDAVVLAARIAAGTIVGYRSGLPRLAGSGVTCVICSPAGPGPEPHREKNVPATQWDHCHVHGTVRGPLCGSCNSVMSKVDDGEPWFWDGRSSLDDARFRQYRTRCRQCPPGAPDRSQRAVERDARVRLAARLITARAAGPRPVAAACAWCPVMQAVHGVPPNRDRRYQHRTIRRWLISNGYTITQSAIDEMPAQHGPG